MDDQKQTTPKGAEIPIPSRSNWERNLRKVVKPKPEGSTSDGPEKK